MSKKRYLNLVFKIIPFLGVALFFLSVNVFSTYSLLAPDAQFYSQNYDQYDHTKAVVWNVRKSTAEAGIKSYHMDYGDGTSDTIIASDLGESDPVFSYTYSVHGYFDTVLTITDNNNSIATLDSHAYNKVAFYYSDKKTYYVSPNGDDLNTGLSENQALKDFKNAVYRMSLGDTLIVLPGTYEVIGFNAWCQDQYKKNMFLGYESDWDGVSRTTIKGKDGEARPSIIAWKDESKKNISGLAFNKGFGITVEHLDIHGGLSYGNHMIYRDNYLGGEGTTYAVSGGHNDSIIENNYIHDLYGGSTYGATNDAIGIYITGQDNVIRNNFFRNMGQHCINSNSTKDEYGSTIPSSGWLIDSNICTETNGHGIGLQNVKDFLIRNNVLVNVGSQAISLGGSKTGDRNIKIIGNTIYNGNRNYAGLYIYNTDVEGLVFENNILVHKRPVTFTDAAKQLTKEKLLTYSFRNNIYYNPYNGEEKIFYNSGTTDSDMDLSEWQTYTKNIMQDGIGLEKDSQVALPGVVSPPSSDVDYLSFFYTNTIDLRLADNSLAIDKGIDNGLYDVDFNGYKRPEGSTFDIGAYEYYTGQADIPVDYFNDINNEESPDDIITDTSNTNDDTEENNDDDSSSGIVDDVVLQSDYSDIMDKDLSIEVLSDDDLKVIYDIYEEVVDYADMDAKVVTVLTELESDEIIKHNIFVDLTENEIRLYQLVLSGMEVDQNVKYCIAYFIKYGSKTSKQLGSGERAGVLNSYKSAFGKIPSQVDEWQDVIKIANGRWPQEESLESLAKAKESFVGVYKRDASMQAPYDNAAVSIIAYGLRPAKRNMDSEQAGIRIFKDIYKKNPSLAIDWDIVRAIAYSGATR